MNASLECHEEVSRKGEAQPCDNTAVAMRYDPTFGGSYPVCAYHSRADMVPLSEVKADAWDEGATASYGDDLPPEFLARNPYREVSA